MDNKLNNREFLHSLSRISDRINQFDRDLKRFKREFYADVKALSDDSKLIRNAFETLYVDLTGNKNKKTEKKGVNKNESKSNS